MSKGFIFPFLPEIQIQEKLLWREKKNCAAITLLNGTEEREKIETGDRTEKTACYYSRYKYSIWLNKLGKENVQALFKCEKRNKNSCYGGLLLLSLRERRKEIEEVSDKAFKK